MSAPTSKLMTPAEVAVLFHVDPKTVTRWANAGLLASTRTLGGHRRFRRADVEAHLGELADGKPRVVRRDVWQDGSYQEVYSDGSSGPVVRVTAETPALDHCGEQGLSGYACTREPDHAGGHQASVGATVLLTWGEELAS